MRFMSECSGLKGSRRLCRSDCAKHYDAPLGKRTRPQMFGSAMKETVRRLIKGTVVRWVTIKQPILRRARLMNTQFQLNRNRLN